MNEELKSSVEKASNTDELQKIISNENQPISITFEDVTNTQSAKRALWVVLLLISTLLDNVIAILLVALIAVFFLGSRTSQLQHISRCLLAKEKIANEKIDLYQINSIEEGNQQMSEITQRKDALELSISTTTAAIAVNQARLNSLGEEIQNLINQHGFSSSDEIDEYLTLKEKLDKETKKLDSTTTKLQKISGLYRAINEGIKEFSACGSTDKLLTVTPEDVDLYAPTVLLELKNLDVPDLRKASRENAKTIDKLLDAYKSRYTTKTNRSIYHLLVIALKAEIQNVLYKLKYGTLEEAINQINEICQKYELLLAEGNKSIAPTLAAFIKEIQFLFISAAKIEYQYYVKKEQQRQEQLEIKQRMREEEEERKRLNAERKKIENEESKYENEIIKTKEKLSACTDDAELNELKAKILELESQLNNIYIEKDKIINLQNGKAGNVYIISNLGSFGGQMFKIGMTRRLDPQDRVNELGSASVPFKFDVHSFIFSEDAVELENQLHKRLDKKRVNKINMRKEFFYADINELEQLVHDIDPTAEFNSTMVAEEYKRSQEQINE